jgi:hypothetical protein
VSLCAVISRGGRWCAATCDAMRRAPGWVRDHAMARLVQGTGRDDKT